MLVFDNRYGWVLDEVGLEPVLNKRYVDDSNLVGEGIKEGTSIVRNEEGKLTLEIGNEEVNEGESSTARTARVYRELANKIMPDSVEMEEDIGENHPNSRLPILDCEMWIENGQKIRHRFYKKPMATEEVVWERSALPISSKTNISLEEMGRRLKNCDIDTPWEE